MKKRLFVCVLTVCLLIGVLCLPGQATDYKGYCGENIKWHFNATYGTLTLTGSGPMYDYSGTTSPWPYIKDKIREVSIGEGITYIGVSAFSHCENLSVISLPSTITGFGSSVFYGCESLTSFKIPKTVTVIPGSMFNGCSNLKRVTLHDGITEIGGWAFAGCSKLSAITLPEGVTRLATGVFSGCMSFETFTVPGRITEIGNKAFEHCSGLKKVIIEEGVSYINRWAFSYCSSLTEVTIPASVTGMHLVFDTPFVNCASLKAVHVKPDNPSFASVDGVLYDKQVKELILVPSGYTGTLTVPDTVETILEGAATGADITALKLGANVKTVGSEAFSYCRQLQSVLLNEGLQTIGSDVFSDCDALRSVYIPGTVTSWNSAFAECGLEQAVLGEGIQMIADNAFSSCSDLIAVVVPESVTEIGEYAFSGCGFVEYTVPDSVKKIGNRAFAYCNKLRAVRIPGTLDEIGDCAFTSCQELKEVTLEEGVRQLCYGAFRDCPALKEIVIPASVIRIGGYAFEYSGLVKVSILGDSVRLGGGVFYECDSLTTVELPEGIEKIESQTFWGCDALAEIEFPDGLLEIQDDVFRSCTALQSVTLPKSLYYIGKNTFGTCSNLKTVYFKGSEEEISLGVNSNNLPYWTAKKVYLGSKPENPFTDVGDGNRFLDAILWGYNSGIVNGKTQTTFEPDAHVTRAQMVTFLWRAAGCPEPASQENPFTDVGDGNRFRTAILWAYHEGITSGKTETTFCPNDFCSRAQVVTFLYRWAGSPDVSDLENPFTDVSPENRFYEEILWAYDNGITSGKTENTFDLNSPCTRAQVVTFMYRYLV